MMTMVPRGEQLLQVHLAPLCRLVSQMPRYNNTTGEREPLNDYRFSARAPPIRGLTVSSHGLALVAPPAG